MNAKGKLQIEAMLEISTSIASLSKKIVSVVTSEQSLSAFEGQLLTSMPDITGIGFTDVALPAHKDITPFVSTDSFATTISEGKGAIIVIAWLHLLFS